MLWRVIWAHVGFANHETLSWGARIDVIGELIIQNGDQIYINRPRSEWHALAQSLTASPDCGEAFTIFSNSARLTRGMNLENPKLLKLTRMDTTCAAYSSAAVQSSSDTPLLAFIDETSANSPGAVEKVTRMNWKRF